MERSDQGKIINVERARGKSLRRTKSLRSAAANQNEKGREKIHEKIDKGEEREG